MSPQVSIVIVNFNQAALTLECIGSINRVATPCTFEIVVVDNASDPADVARLNEVPKSVRLIRLTRNVFFGEASNIGSEFSAGEYLLLLNNDVQVTDGWLDGLMATLKNEYRAGAVCPKVVYPGGELQEAGCLVRPDGWGIQIGKSKMQVPASFISANRVADYGSGACLLMRKATFLALGGFDPIFEPAYFEDVDLAIRLRATGLFTYYCANATVSHVEAVTSKKVWSPEQRNRYITANHSRLMKRWGDYVETRIDKDVEPRPLKPVVWENERTDPVVDPVVLYTSVLRAEGDLSRSLVAAAAAFQNYRDVVIATDDGCSRCRIYSLAREFGVDLTSFRTRRLSEISPSPGAVLMSFSREGNPEFGAWRHLEFARDGWEVMKAFEESQAMANSPRH